MCVLSRLMRPIKGGVSAQAGGSSPGAWQGRAARVRCFSIKSTFESFVSLLLCDHSSQSVRQSHTLKLLFSPRAVQAGGGVRGSLPQGLGSTETHAHSLPSALPQPSFKCLRLSGLLCKWGSGAFSAPVWLPPRRILKAFQNYVFFWGSLESPRSAVAICPLYEKNLLCCIPDVLVPEIDVVN